MFRLSSVPNSSQACPVKLTMLDNSCPQMTQNILKWPWVLRILSPESEDLPVSKFFASFLAPPWGWHVYLNLKMTVGNFCGWSMTKAIMYISQKRMLFLGCSLGCLSRFTQMLTYNMNFPYAVGKHQKEYGVDRRAENSVSLTTFAVNRVSLI